MKHPELLRLHSRLLSDTDIESVSVDVASPKDMMRLSSGDLDADNAENAEDPGDTRADSASPDEGVEQAPTPPAPAPPAPPVPATLADAMRIAQAVNFTADGKLRNWQFVSNLRHAGPNGPIPSEQDGARAQYHEIKPFLKSAEGEIRDSLLLSTTRLLPGLPARERYDAVAVLCGGLRDGRIQLASFTGRVVFDGLRHILPSLPAIEKKAVFLALVQAVRDAEFPPPRARAGQPGQDQAHQDAARRQMLQSLITSLPFNHVYEKPWHKYSYGGISVVALNTDRTECGLALLGAFGAVRNAQHHATLLTDFGRFLASFSREQPGALLLPVARGGDSLLGAYRRQLQSSPLASQITRDLQSFRRDPATAQAFTRLMKLPDTLPDHAG